MPPEPPIRILPDHVANQIAAGEVIERPAAVVKELLENSLDAGARRIRIAFRNGGKSLIRVEDDGWGMSPDAALMALERHATSKLRVAKDLDSLATMGFRGEALPSIASVSKFLLQTRRPDAAEGCEVLMQGGKLIHQRSCGVPPGTRIEVTQLFNSVPARRQFLKTEATEAAHIIQLVRLHAVAHPQTAFELEDSGRRVLHTPACPGIRDRVSEIWGRELAEDLLEISDQPEHGLRLRGLIGKPGLGRSSRRELVTIVNGRPVDTRTLAYAVIEAYHTLLPKGRYPVGFLMLDLDPAAVDVNVHPAKREVRFRRESEVRQYVVRRVLGTLQSHGTFQPTKPAPSPPETPPRPAVTPAPKPEPTWQPRPTRQPISDQFRKRYIDDAARQADKLLTQRKAEAAPTPATNPQAPETEPKPAPPPPAAPKLPSLANWRYLARLQQGWGLFETPQGLVVLHPRAASERIVYEQVLAHFEGQPVNRQQLLLPLTLHLEPLQAAGLQPWLPMLDEAGFTIENFGRDCVRLTAYPDWLGNANVQQFLDDLVPRLVAGEVHPRKPRLAQQHLARLAAAKALWRGDLETPEAFEILASQLMNCAQPLTCPNGKPTLLEWSHRDLAKRFAR